MDIERLYQDYNIDYLSEGNKHCTPGFINVHCPFCEGSKNYHLGYDLKGGYFTCWRCGWHPVVETIARLLGRTTKEAYKIIQEYGGKSRPVHKDRADPIIKIRTKAHRLPSGTGSLTEAHKRYLRNRGFIPEILIQKWALLGTGPMAMLDGLNYCHRIIIPIFWEGKQVSFQGRDITGKGEFKYLTCPQDREEIPSKTILYGQPKQFENWDTCIVVEGVFDAWRVGELAVATFGIKYKSEQLRLLSRFKRVIVWFDEEPQAQEQAKKLVSELRFRGVKASQIFHLGDPASTPQDEVNQIIQEVLRNGG